MTAGSLPEHDGGGDDGRADRADERHRSDDPAGRSPPSGSPATRPLQATRGCTRTTTSGAGRSPPHTQGKEQPDDRHQRGRAQAAAQLRERAADLTDPTHVCGRLGVKHPRERNPMTEQKYQYNMEDDPSPAEVQRRKIEALAALILAQSRERIAAMGYHSQVDGETVQVRPGAKYTKIDRGPQHNMSGMLMVEHSTGLIFGIKGYGVIHRGHPYGSLDTISEWNWGGYYPEPVGMCPGSGRTWGSGTGAPICPACHTGPGGLHVPAPRRAKGRFTGHVPVHNRRDS